MEISSNAEEPGQQAWCYLQKLVAGKEVGRRLENGGHGFGQLLMHCLIFRCNVRLSLIGKLEKKKKRKRLYFAGFFKLRGRKLARLPRTEMGTEVHTQGWEKG